MDNNVNFRQDLIINYLCQLVSLDNREEFDKFYPYVEAYLPEALTKSAELENKVRDIIAFNSKSVEMKK